MGSACAKFYQSNIMLTRTMTLLLKCSPARPGATDLLHSDTLSATHLLPVIEDNLDTYITILESLQSSVVSPREGSSSTSDSSPSTETSSSGLSLPKGISASFISVLEKQVHKLIQVLKTLVVYSAPVRHVLLGQHSSSSRNTHTSAQVPREIWSLKSVNKPKCFLDYHNYRIATMINYSRVNNFVYCDYMLQKIYLPMVYFFPLRGTKCILLNIQIS